MSFIPVLQTHLDLLFRGKYFVVKILYCRKKRLNQISTPLFTQYYYQKKLSFHNVKIEKMD
jgi:hypothetical protein